MDIAKYIGLFLLKNHFCYVHGIGNLELVKRPAIHDGKVLQAPNYEVIVTPGGSIDDNLANFIATNEQISISKAANALRDFSILARKEMAAGAEVPISNIGKLVEVSGKIKFITDDNFRFTPAGIPTIKNSKQLDEQNARLAHKPAYPPPAKADSVNWSMVVLVIVLLIIISGGIYGIWYYTNQNKTISPPPPAKDTVIQNPIPLVPPLDTVHKDTATSFPPAVTQDSLQVNNYKMVIGEYATLDKATKREYKLTHGGNKVEIITKDSTHYYIVGAVTCSAADTTHIKDSLARMFGYKGVSIYR